MSKIKCLAPQFEHWNVLTPHDDNVDDVTKGREIRLDCAK